MANKKTKRAKNIFGTTEKPRLSVNKSIKHISAQIIDDVKGVTIAAVTSAKGEKNNIETAKKVGKSLGEKAKAAGIKSIVFDRRHYRFHGKIKALAEEVKAAGLQL